MRLAYVGQTERQVLPAQRAVPAQPDQRERRECLALAAHLAGKETRGLRAPPGIRAHSDSWAGQELREPAAGRELEVRLGR